MHGDNGGMSTKPAPAAPATKKRMLAGPLRNVIWGLLITVGVVVIVGVAFFDVGSQKGLEREPLANSTVDVQASAERAQGSLPFPVAAPQMGEEWQARLARLHGGAALRWEVRVTSPSGALVTMTQAADQATATQGGAVMPGARVVEERTVQGASCQVLERTDEKGEARHGMTCQTEKFALVVRSAGSAAEVEQFMDAALTDAAARSAQQ